MSSLDTLTTVLKSSFADTRLLTRLVICCLHPIMDDSHAKLLELTAEEAELLLSIITQLKKSCRLDPAKLLKATSVLFREFPLQSIPAQFFTDLCQTTFSLLSNNYDICITEGALCLLWTLACYIPEVKYYMSQMKNLVSTLTSLQQSPCSIISSPARSVLFVLNQGSYEGM